MACDNCSQEYLLAGAANNPINALWIPKQEYDALKGREQESSQMMAQALSDAQKKYFDMALKYVQAGRSKKGMHQRLRLLCVSVPPLKKISGKLSKEYIDEPLAEYFNYQSIRNVLRTLNLSDSGLETRMQEVEAYVAETETRRKEMYDDARKAE